MEIRKVFLKHKQLQMEIENLDIIIVWKVLAKICKTNKNDKMGFQFITTT